MKSPTPKLLTLLPTLLILMSVGTGNAAAENDPIHSFMHYSNAQYGTAGVGLRNRPAADINISGVVPPVQDAYLYWAVMTNGPGPVRSKMKFRRMWPKPASKVITLVGDAIGTRTGNMPCDWVASGADRITVYRAQIDVTVANGNGTYTVEEVNPGPGLTTGEDPWSGIYQLPLWDGASLVLIGTGLQTVSIFDDGITGNTFNASAGLNYTLQLPAATNASILFDEIGADGQHGDDSRDPDVPYPDEQTWVNSNAFTYQMAGPGSDYNDSDWNGSSAFPLPELWDDTTHGVPVGPNTNRLFVSIFTNSALQGDCITPVANVVQQFP